jgi:hypothetical protein
MLIEKISPIIDKIRSIDGVEACVLVSRDGIIAGKNFDRELMSHGLEFSWQQSLHPLSQSEGVLP